jgi:hypothetical protein
MASRAPKRPLEDPSAPPAKVACLTIGNCASGADGVGCVVGHVPRDALAFAIPRTEVLPPFVTLFALLPADTNLHGLGGAFSSAPSRRAGPAEFPILEGPAPSTLRLRVFLLGWTLGC